VDEGACHAVPYAAVTRLNPWLMQVAPAIFLLLWSAGFPVAKMGLEYAMPLAFLSICYALTVIALAVLFVVLKPGLPKGLKAWRHLAAVGFLIQVMYFGLSYLALQAGVSASMVALIVSLQPILVGLLVDKI
jgi:drug/metabolite transporter (DMT)-like permease